MERKLASGEYVTEAELMSNALDLLQHRDDDMDRWLREEVVPACIEFENDPSTALSANEVLKELDQARSTPHKRSA